MDEEAFRTRWQMKIKWRHRQHCEWSRQQHDLLYVFKWQMIRFQALWKTKSFVKVCLKFKLPLWTKGLLIHLSPLWQLPLWHFPRWHNFPVYVNKLLCNLHSHKTTCPKGVPSWLLKEIAEVAPAVTLIMQASLDLCCIPFSWKRHWSSRYFRKGNRSAESSNRPPSPPSSVRCVNTSSTVLTLVISLNMTPSPTHNMASAKDLVTPNSYVQSMT